jgi:3-deoxy-D-manno-octulosonic-acid transferase
MVFRLLGAHPVTRAAGVLAKSKRMSDRFRALSSPCIEVAGETRFDIERPQAHVEAGLRLKASLGDRPVFAFASVVEGEEETYLRASKTFAAMVPKPLVIWVPRAPEVFDATAEWIDAAGLVLRRRSESLSNDLDPLVSLEDTDVLLGDSFGEMFFYLASADAVSVGGGFVEKGAHNVIEPLALGKPVIVGPHIWTIEFPGREARDAGVLQVCADPASLATMLLAAQGASGAAAEDFHRNNLGASEKIVALVNREMERSA